MKPAIVKWTVDLYAPGAIITPTMTTWIAKWDTFHSRRAVWPNLPMGQLMDIQDDGSMALVDFCHIRYSSIMDGYDGPRDGPLDTIPSLKPMQEVFDLTRVCGTALGVSRPYQAGITRAGWVELFETDGEVANYICPLTIRKIAEPANRAPTE